MYHAICKQEKINTILFTPHYCRFDSSPAPWEKEDEGSLCRTLLMFMLLLFYCQHLFKIFSPSLCTWILETSICISSERCIQVCFFPYVRDSSSYLYV